MHRRVWWTLGTAMMVALGWATASPCYANLIFTLGNNPQPNQENILFGAKEQASSIIGATNQTSTNVLFSTTASYLLNQQSSGQADVSAIANHHSVNLTNITITPALHVRGMILDMQHGTGTVLVTVKGDDAHGHPLTGTFNMTLGNGSNYLTITTSGGDSITSVTLDTGSNGSFQDLKQPRVAGVLQPMAVPEPASMSLLALGALGIVGLGWRQRRRHHAA